MEVKGGHLVLSSGIGLAGLAVSNFWDYSSEAFFTSKTKLLPNKMTAIHQGLTPVFETGIKTPL
ncbi:hypothetical protein AB0R87_12935 [Bacillus pumilus]|uniref:hypothetical protein n=1 Tax=Bacillus pumilus TaxID=1408 RepID=UPI002864FAB9|nr:hypothetical protein [Bacillus pumilus]MDR7248947.1 hypothetical protein [Bacillus pumilus]